VYKELGSASLKYDARARLNGKWPLAVCVSLVAGILGGGQLGSVYNFYKNFNTNFKVPLPPAAIPILAAVFGFAFIWAIVSFFTGPALTLGH